MTKHNGCDIRKSPMPLHVVRDMWGCAAKILYTLWRWNRVRVVHDHHLGLKILNVDPTIHDHLPLYCVNSEIVLVVQINPTDVNFMLSFFFYPLDSWKMMGFKKIGQQACSQKGDQINWKFHRCYKLMVYILQVFRNIQIKTRTWSWEKTNDMRQKDTSVRVH